MSVSSKTPCKFCGATAPWAHLECCPRYIQSSTGDILVIVGFLAAVTTTYIALFQRLNF